MHKSTYLSPHLHACSLLMLRKTQRMRVKFVGHLELVERVDNRHRDRDVCGDVAGGEDEVEAVHAAPAQLAEVTRLAVQLAHEPLLARQVAQRVGSGQVPARKEKELLLSLNSFLC